MIQGDWENANIQGRWACCHYEWTTHASSLVSLRMPWEHLEEYLSKFVFIFIMMVLRVGEGWWSSLHKRWKRLKDCNCSQAMLS